MTDDVLFVRRRAGQFGFKAFPAIDMRKYTETAIVQSVTQYVRHARRTPGIGRITFHNGKLAVEALQRFKCRQIA